MTELMIWTILILSSLSVTHGQDERFFQKLYSRQRQQKAELGPREYSWEFWGKVFRYDLNGDGIAEGLQAAKKDHENWFYIRESGGRVLAAYQLETRGREGRLYRIKIKQIADQLKLLILYFYEGFTEWSEFYGTATLYFLVLNASDLNSLKWTKGPTMWLEHKTVTGYRQRDYGIKIQDMDGDGIKEVMVHQGHIQRIFRYFPGLGMKSLI